jgi:hypothetical protein
MMDPMLEQYFDALEEAIVLLEKSKESLKRACLESKMGPGEDFDAATTVFTEAQDAVSEAFGLLVDVVHDGPDDDDEEDEEDE